MTKAGRNDPCPCGSGRKFKKCCHDRMAATRFTQTDRALALARLDRFIADELGPEDDAAFEEFWGDLADRAGELDDDWSELSEAVVDSWFAFDRPLEGGRPAVDRFLEVHAQLPAGERAFLEMMRDTSMRLYEVVDAVPGVSLTLRDVLEGDQVTVHERLGSRSISRFEWLAARLVARGASGQPEIEAGLMQLPELLRESVRGQLAAHREDFLRKNPGADVRAFYKSTAPFFHSAWAGAVLDPVVPALRNTDGEEMVITRVTFDAGDAAALQTVLDASTELTRREGSRWGWSGENARGEVVSLGHLELVRDTLVLEANSVERGDRGRRLVEALAGEAVRHRSTTHADLANEVRDRLRKRDPDEGTGERGAGEIPREVAEDLALNHYARHYRGWIDEPVPALDGRTPREAAGDAGLRARLVDLLRQLERMYQDALRSDAPAYDPSWMWSELGLEAGTAPAHPPPLAHERVAALLPGSGPLCRAVAERRRGQPGFDDATTLVSDEELRAQLDVQRFLREREGRPQEPGGVPTTPRNTLPAWLRLVTDFELHRRKAFWVDEALAFMLDHTELDVVGRELRVPFPSFALVFTDRHVLSLAERLLARERTSPLAGQILRVLSVYVSEIRNGESRTLRLSFAPDALGADLPGLVQHDVPLADDAPVHAWLDGVAPRPAIEPAPPDTHPLRGLVRIVMNAILYATSAGVEAQVRAAPAASRRADRSPAPVSSDGVYFLPGVIEISHLRRMQALERIPDGREVLRRFMVRGHWRRAAPSWTDQRHRWIQPYWKGPDLAAVIERTYELKP